MDDLSLIFPQPQPVTIGSWSGQAICFQLRDLARLQSTIKSLAPDPLGSRLKLLDARRAAGGDYLGGSPASQAYAGMLRRAIRELMTWPPKLSTREGDRLLATNAGRVLWLDTLLGRPGLNPGFHAGIAASMIADERATEDQWLMLDEIAHADHPGDLINRLTDVPRPRKSRPIDWGKAIVEFSIECGWPPNVIGEMYLSQWYAWKSGGRWNPGQPGGSQANIREFRERRRRLMQGDVGRNGTGH